MSTDISLDACHHFQDSGCFIDLYRACASVSLICCLQVGLGKNYEILCKAFDQEAKTNLEVLLPSKLYFFMLACCANTFLTNSQTQTSTNVTRCGDLIGVCPGHCEDSACTLSGHVLL